MGEAWIEYLKLSNSNLGRERAPPGLGVLGPLSGLVNRQYSQVQARKRKLFHTALLPMIERLSSGELNSTGIALPRKMSSKRVKISAELWSRVKY